MNRIIFLKITLFPVRNRTWAAVVAALLFGVSTSYWVDGSVAPDCQKPAPGCCSFFSIGPLTYICLPIRAWWGADWTFNTSGTWDGSWSNVFDNKAERIVEVPKSSGQRSARIEADLNLLAGHWPRQLLVTDLLRSLLDGSNVSRRQHTGLILL